MEIFLVGGAVRDKLMGRDSKDWDFTVVLEPNDWGFASAHDATPFEVMRWRLEDRGFTVFLADEAHGTVRAKAPKGFTFAGMTPAVRTFDFVLARRDVSTDGRHAVTEPGTLLDDLARRDFTVNAMAIDAAGNLIDPHGGAGDLRNSLRTVGMAKARLREDGLRALRAVRFAVTLRVDFHRSLRGALMSHGAFFAMQPSISVERRREELLKAFRVDAVATIARLQEVNMLKIVDADGLWLKPTLEAR